MFDFLRAKPRQTEPPAERRDLWYAGFATRPHLGHCIVMKLAEGSPAYLAGIREGDEVTEVDYCPVTPENVIQKYQEVREAPGSQVIFTIRRKDTDIVEEIVVDRKPLNYKLNSELDALSTFDIADKKLAVPPWKFSHRALKDRRTHCFIVTVDAGFKADDFQEMIPELKRATGSWYTSNMCIRRVFDDNPYDENTAHCIVARAASVEENTTPKVAAALLLGPLTPSKLQPFEWEIACVRVTKDSNWQDDLVATTLQTTALRVKDPSTRTRVSPLNLAAAIAVALQKFGGDVSPTPCVVFSSSSPPSEPALPI